MIEEVVAVIQYRAVGSFHAVVISQVKQLLLGSLEAVWTELCKQGGWQAEKLTVRGFVHVPAYSTEQTLRI